MCAQHLIANNPPPTPRPFILLGSLLTSNIQPLTSAFPCAPLTQALALDSCFSHQSPACPEHQRRVTAHQSHAALSLFAGGWVAIFQFRFSSFQSISPLECAVEHPMKDASPACPEPRRREGVSRPKDLNVHVSLLECAVTQNAVLTPLECAVAKMRPCNPFRMRSYKKTGGRGVCPS